MKVDAKNAFGGSLPSIILMGSILPLFAGLIIREKELVRKMFAGVALTVTALALGLLIYRTLPGQAQSPKFVGLATSWEIAVDSVKNSPIWGMGPGNYLTAFNLYRPVSYNSTDLWGAKFSTARNFYLTLMTETGFAGILAFGILFAGLYAVLFKNFKPEVVNSSLFEKLSLLTLVVLFAIFPASTLLMFPFFILVAILSRSEENIVEFGATNASSRLPAYVLGLPVIALAIAGIVFGARVVSAEAKYKKSLDSLALNDAQATYDNMRAAVSANPKVDRYHTSFAQVNMALASSIASKENIGDAEKQAVSQLVQQAISEGKAAVALNMQRSGNWETLAGIYRSIMPFAQGADSFAIQTFTQAIALDPINPNLRISLGGTYYALGRYDEAIEAFKLAVIAKPDLANAHYNLAAAYREKKDFDKAIEQMNAVLSLVEKDSPDYNLAKAELENLEKNRPAKEVEPTENLTPPAEIEESNITPPIVLPEEATPPETQTN